MRLFGRGKKENREEEISENSAENEIFRADDFKDADGMENTIITESLSNIFRFEVNSEDFFEALTNYNSGTKANAYWVIPDEIAYARDNFEYFYRTLLEKFENRLKNPKAWSTDTTYNLIKQAFREL